MTDESCYDPRDPEQRASDRSTWKVTTNPALQMARIQHASWNYVEMPDGYWGGVADMANCCDEFMARVVDDTAAILGLNNKQPSARWMRVLRWLFASGGVVSDPQGKP